MNLDDLRKRIDSLDREIIELIAERTSVTRQIGDAKKDIGKPIEDKIRERKVLDHVRQMAESKGLNPAEIERIYQGIIAVSKEVQGVTVAFQGETGAYSEEAAYQFFGENARLKACESLEDVFSAVDRGETRYGIVPLENSLEGSITRTYDLLLDYDLKVCGEHKLRVVHSLIGLPETNLDAVREVYSHQQALGQCKTFLRQMGWKVIPSYDTAGSVKMIKDTHALHKAAIASARSAEIYGMKVLKRGIEDTVNNFTRFFVLSKQEAPPSGDDKTSIVFSVKHTPGALYDALKEFSARKINMTKIESRPTRQKPWEYNFYVDFDGHYQDESIKEALTALHNSTINVKILGSYPRVK